MSSFRSRHKRSDWSKLGANQERKMATCGAEQPFHSGNKTPRTKSIKSVPFFAKNRENLFPFSHEKNSALSGLVIECIFPLSQSGDTFCEGLLLPSKVAILTRSYNDKTKKRKTPSPFAKIEEAYGFYLVRKCLV